MRYIAVTLLLANLAYLGWVQMRPQVVQESPPARELLNTGITLVDEFQAQAGTAPRPDTNASDTLQCSRVAGLMSLDGANSLMVEARDMGLEAALELSGAALPSHYRVYLPPASSRAIATISLDGLAERLRAADLGIDSYLITRGQLENAIALGVFAL